VPLPRTYQDAGDFRRRVFATSSFKQMLSIFQDCLQDAHAGKLGGSTFLAKKYRELSLLFHPDKCAEEEREKATEAFKALVEAYSIERPWAQ